MSSAAIDAPALAAGIGDDRLRMLFACAHPAIDAAARAPLMLQAVLGLSAQAIASAFCVSPTSMGQRLVRAKARIRDLAIPFDLPDEVEALRERLESVLDAIYAAFNAGWSEATSDPASRGLEQEAIRLAGLIVERMPGEPEPRGLWSLMSYCHARRAARVDADGAYVPLSEQDATRWDRAMIDAAERCLHEASRQRRIGPYQLEAAIQSAHARRAIDGGATPWADVLALYDASIACRPSLGAHVGRAAARLHAGDPTAALAALDVLPIERVDGYQPFYAARAHALAATGNVAAARDAFDRAIGLSDDPAARAYLLGRRDRVAAAGDGSPRR